MPDKKILVIEDDADQRLGYQVLLRAHHYQTFFAFDSVTAMDEARHHRPDLIILDLGLLACDGFILMERFRASSYLSATPVIVVSARDPHQNRERALQFGARAYVQKPWNDAELLALIASLSAGQLAPA
jgi:DNA-binding response OmpR family regulator